MNIMEIQNVQYASLAHSALLLLRSILTAPEWGAAAVWMSKLHSP